MEYDESEMSVDEDEEIEPDLTPELFQKSELTDITLIVEGKELHFAKYPLSAGSTVFAYMMKGNEEKSRLVLYDVPYNDMIMFLECLHPKTLQIITDMNLEQVARIAHRFKHEGILYRCEKYIIEKFNQVSESKDGMYPKFFFHLKVADKYEMEKAIQVGVSSERVEKAYFSGYPHEFPKPTRYTSKPTGYENNKDFKELSADTKIQILSRRLRSAETGIRSDS